MLQRVQTLYFILACSFLSVPLFRAPLFSMQFGKANPLVGNAFESIILGKNVASNQFFVLIIVLILLLVAIIFSFKKRTRQMFLSRLVFVLIFLTGLWMYLGARVQLDGKFKNLQGSNLNMEWGFYLFMISVFFVSQAIRTVKKDEKLVRSLDRIR